MVIRTRRIVVLLIVASGIAAVAAIALAALPFATVRTFLDACAGDESADPYTPELHHRLRMFFATCGVATLLIATGLLTGRRYAESCLDAWRPRWRTDATVLTRRWRALVHGMGFWIAGVTLLAGAVRAMYLDQPMRFDESYTYLTYAAQPWFVTLSKYDAPNNHVFHSLCVLVATRVLGDAPWAIRLPAFLAGMLTVPATMLLARRIGGRTAAVLAGLIVATSSALIEYSTNARGYTLICLFTVLAWLLAVDLVRRPNPVGWVLLSACLALGCWTVPTMVYPLVMLVAWMVLHVAIGSADGRWVRRFLGGLTASLGCTGVVAAALYAPVLLVEGPRALFANSYVQPHAWGRFFDRLPAWLQELESLLLRDVPGVVQTVLVVGLVASVMTHSRATRSCRTAALGSVAACAAVCLLQRVLPFARAWLFLVPLAAVLSAAGLAGVLAMVPRPLFRRAGATTAVLALAGWPLWNTIHDDSIGRSLETGTLTDADQIIVFLKDALRPGESIVAVSPSSAPLVYYARRRGLDVHHFAWPATDHTRDDHAVIVVNRIDPQTIASVLGDLGLEPLLARREFVLLAKYPSAWLYRMGASPQVSEPHREADDN